MLDVHAAIQLLAFSIIFIILFCHVVMLSSWRRPYYVSTSAATFYSYDSRSPLHFSQLARRPKPDYWVRVATTWRHRDGAISNVCRARLTRCTPRCSCFTRLSITPFRHFARHNTTSKQKRCAWRRSSICADPDSDFSSDARRVDWQRRCRRAWPAPSATAANRSAGYYKLAAARASWVGHGLPRLAAQVCKSPLMYEGLRRPHLCLSGERRELSGYIWAPARPLGPRHHLVARRKRSRESTSFSFLCWQSRLHCFQEWSHHAHRTARVRRLIPQTAAQTRSGRFQIHRVLHRTHEGSDDACLPQVPDWASARTCSRTFTLDFATRRHVTIYGVTAHAVASPGKMRSKWRRPVNCRAHRTDPFLTPPSRVTHRARRSRSTHKAPRRRAIIAQSRRHVHPATHDVVTSTKVRALNRVTGAPPIPVTPLRRQSACKSSIQLQVRPTAPHRISTRRTRRTWLETPTCTLVRCLQQPPNVFNSYRQLHPYQHTPCSLFQQPCGLQTGNGAPTLDFYSISLLADTFTQPLPNDQ